MSILPPTPLEQLAQTLQSVLGECALRAGFVHRFVKRRSQRAKLNGATWV